MTYTFKLARRLAVSRKFRMLPAILLFAACSGDATAPDGSQWTGSPEEPGFRRTVPMTVNVSPSTVTVETNQLIQFVARGTTLDGDTVAAAVDWSASGGTILADGRYSAAATGTFMVVARSQERQTERIDTAVVKVVRRQTSLDSLAISPGTTTLSPGISQTFVVTGYLKDGRAVPVGAHWSATGGSIDAGGNYIAGDTAGTYHVIATNSFRPIADTAIVTIGAPPPPPPPPPAPAPPPTDTTPPPAPVVEKVMLIPASATLAPATKRQFYAYGLVANGDSVAAEVVFTSTGGTVTAGGLFTAGSTAGNYRVIATAGALADTSTITVTQPLGSGPVGTGVPFGAWATWNSDETLKANTGVFSASMGAVGPSDIVQRIAAARTKGKKLMLAMTGGHEPYLTNGVFDRSKWNAVMQAYNTPLIRDAVAKAVADGTIIGNSVMDEPQVRGLGDGNTWGPQGTMTKVRVDSLCGYVKNIFPTMPVGVVHTHDAFEPTKSYRTCEFVVSQYEVRMGSVTAFRDAGLAMARRDGHAIAFSFNILNGGIQAARDGLWNCPLTTTGGRGTYNPNCRMTAEQVRNVGLVLGPAGCSLLMWRYDSSFMANAANIEAFEDVAARLASTPVSSCRRP